MSTTGIIDRLCTAVAVGDIDAAELAVAQIRAWAAAHPNELCHSEPLHLSRLTDALLELGRLKRAGPVVDDPDAHIERIHTALDAEDGDEARRLMTELSGSWASYGPQPSSTGQKRLGHALYRPEWASGEFEFVKKGPPTRPRHGDFKVTDYSEETSKVHEDSDGPDTHIKRIHTAPEPGYYRVDGLPNGYARYWMVKRHRHDTVNNGEPYDCAWGFSLWGHGGEEPTWAYRTFGSEVSKLMGRFPDAHWEPDQDRTLASRADPIGEIRKKTP